MNTHSNAISIKGSLSSEVALIIFHGRWDGHFPCYSRRWSPRRSGAIDLSGGSPGKRVTFFTLIRLWQIVASPLFVICLSIINVQVGKSLSSEELEYSSFSYVCCVSIKHGCCFGSMAVGLLQFGYTVFLICNAVNNSDFAMNKISLYNRDKSLVLATSLYSWNVMC